MQRTIVPENRYFSEEISPGVVHEKFYPGGLKGPNGECDNPVMGGQTWTDVVYLGTEQDRFQLMLPDIRMPPNQYWPLHWHDCWTVVLVIEGSCMIGDWVFEKGDIFLTIPSLEYGPLVIGPKGCRLFEIFAQAHLAAGGYSPEYADHPTLQGSFKAFFDRSELNRRNAGRQSLPCDGVEGVWKLKLEPDLVVNMGEADDPDRGVLRDQRLLPGQEIPAEKTPEWRMLIVMEGSVEYSGRTLGKDEFLRVAPGAASAPIKAGAQGAQLLELGLTAAALPAR